MLYQGLTKLGEGEAQAALRPGRPQVKQQHIRWAGLRAAQGHRQAGGCALDVEMIAAQRQDRL